MPASTISRRPLTALSPARNSIRRNAIHCSCTSRSTHPRARGAGNTPCPPCACPLCASCPLCALAIVALALVSPGPAYAADRQETIEDPCAGRSALLAVIDRPTVADSACVVKPGRVLLEAGYARQTLRGPDAGRLTTLPQAELRLGLPHRLELRLFPPGYNRQTSSLPGTPAVTGYSDTGLGLKYQIGYNERWIWSADTLISLPTGNHAFSNDGTGVTLNGIVGYSLAPRVGLAAMVGVSSLTGEDAQGRTRRYTTVNPNFVVSYQFTEALQVYVEGFGTTHTGPRQGSGYGADGGLQYLVTPRFEIDIEYGTRVSGGLGFSHYVGAGFGVEF